MSKIFITGTAGFIGFHLCKKLIEDGHKIIETAKRIKNKTNSGVSLATTAPVCSKTTSFLNENDIKIIFDYVIK